MGKAKNEKFDNGLIMVKMYSNEPRTNLYKYLKSKYTDNLLPLPLTSVAYFRLNWVFVCVFGSIGYGEPIQFQLK